MRLQQFQNNYLYEGLDRSATQTMMLWESAGFKLKEAALTADQIQQIFQNVEQGATAAGGNRTMLGKGKDAAAAVNKAWEDLKTKVQNSGPIKNVDAAYDSAVAKIETGLGGPDNAINKVIQRYRKFAKEHPIAQGLIYSALIAAAGISGAGLGGAAVLGLLKMADKLLQGEKFSSAAYSGAKTGAMAYGASKIGDMIKGKPEGGVGGGEMSPDMQQRLAADQAFQDRILNKFPPDKGYTFDSAGKSLQVFDANGTKVFTGDIPLKTMDMKTFADLTNNGQMATPGISSGSISSDAMAGVSDKAAGGVTDIDTLKQGIAANSDAAQAATNTDAASAMSSQSDATVKTATDFTSQGAPAGQAASGYAGQGSDAAAAAGDTTTNAANAAGEVTRQSAQEAARAATSRLADAAPGSLGKSAAERMLQQDLHKAVTDAVTSGKLGNPTDLNFTSRINDFVNEYVSENGRLVKEVSGKQIGGTMQQILRSTGELAGKAAAGGTGSSEFVRGALVRDSVQHKGKALSEGQVYMIFNRVCARNDQWLSEGKLIEGPMDWIKDKASQAAGAVAGKAKQIGKNLTTKVTADKLNSAWQKAGSPMDSEEVAKVLTTAGVGDDVVKSVYADLKIPAAGSAADQAAMPDTELDKLIDQLNTKQKKEIVKYLQQQLRAA